MRLKHNREHFRSPDHGQTWIPKRSFETKKDIPLDQYPEHKWHKYRCSFCKRYHVAKIRGLVDG